MELSEIKSKVLQVIDILNTTPEDTTVQNIKSRRDKLFFLSVEKDAVKLTAKSTKSEIAVNEFMEMFDEYNRYFETGFKSKWNIDDLPRLLKEKGIAVIKTLS